jgi:DDE superfamily endonuclease
MVRDNRHDSAHLLGAICPDRGVGAAIIMPAVNTEAMNEHLSEISSQVAPGAHAVLVLDGAGWHQTGGDLKVPDNITLLSLPPYAPVTLIRFAAQADGERLGVSARQQALRRGLEHIRRDHQRMPGRLEIPDRRPRTDPINRHTRLGVCQCLRRLVLNEVKQIMIAST